MPDWLAASNLIVVDDILPYLPFFTGYPHPPLSAHNLIIFVYFWQHDLSLLPIVIVRGCRCIPFSLPHIDHPPNFPLGGVSPS